MKKSALTIGAVTILGQGMAVAQTTSCEAVNRAGNKVHLSECRWVKEVKVVFTGVVPYPITDDSDTSGRVFTGMLEYKVGRKWPDGTSAGPDIDEKNIEVSTGGFFDSLTMNQGPTCDTAYPEDNDYKLTLTPDGKIDGFALNAAVPGRLGLEIHYRIRKTIGSSGCIVFVDGTPCPDNVTLLQWRTHPLNDSEIWKKFDRYMRQTKHCKCQTTNLVPLTVAYELGKDAMGNDIPPPNYIWI